jgi:hypothetical protein
MAARIAPRIGEITLRLIIGPPEPVPADPL